MNFNSLTGKLTVAALVLAGTATASAQTFTNEPASAVWEFNTNPPAAPVVTPGDGISFAFFNLNGNTISGSATPQAMVTDRAFVKIKPKSSGADIVEWIVKPKAGVTFTPTKISGYVCRYGTDGSEHMVTLQLIAGDKTVVLGTCTPFRDNKTQEKDKWGKSDDYTTHFSYDLTPEQQAEVATSGQLRFVSNLGVAAGKELAFSDIHIEGLLNGTVQKVENYTLSAKVSPEGAGSIVISPELDSYEAETPINIKTEKNFGYNFINWTDKDGKEVSTDPELLYQIMANTELTANYKKLNIFALEYSVEGGANSYQIECTPAPTVVNDRNMYEEGTNVTLKAVSNPIVKFTNWSDGQTDSEITFAMDADKSIKGMFEAVDYVAGWDFYRNGNNGRPADFASEGNDIAALELRTADGKTSGWLDKSHASGGYEGRDAGVNWRTTGLGDYYWQTKLNASNFTDMKVITAMGYNYNAYTKQNVEYSLDGTTWAPVGVIEIEGAKNWKDAEFDIPAAANNAATLYLRWISDKTSPIDGTKSDNDGIAIGATYVLGTMKIVDDGKAPELLSTVPAEGSTSASINGKVVLTFNEKIKLAADAEATLGDTKLKGEVSGRTATFVYKNLKYGTQYTFTLPASVITDITDNAYAQPVRISFTTRNRPEVAKATFNFTVPDDGTIIDAFAAADKRDDKTQAYRIFVKNGTYTIPANGTQVKTVILNSPNVSVIGESMEGTIITNECPKNADEGIGKCDLIQIQRNGTNSYWQDITLRHGNDTDGRRLSIHEFSDKTIMKNVTLWAYQDTYTTDNQSGRYYFEGGVLRGRTDYLCGKGDVFYNGVTLQMCGTGGYLTAPSQAKQYGYVFKDCEIVGEDDATDGSFTLGRPWGDGTPMSIWIDTKMTARPTAAGWNDMGDDGYPKRFAEYNSTTANGTVIDLSSRKSIFGKGNHPNNPVLTKEEAEGFSYANVMGGADNWDPASDTEAAPLVSNLRLESNKLVWDDNNYTLCWAVYEGDKLLGFTKEATYPVTNANATYAVRAANERGGLGEKVTLGDSAVEDIEAVAGEPVSREYYDLRGIRVAADTEAEVLIEVSTYADGTVRTAKILK